MGKQEQGEKEEAQFNTGYFLQAQAIHPHPQEP